MKNTMLTLPFLLAMRLLSAQHTSENFKDAAGCGPFPLYISAGYTTSNYDDLTTVGNEFVSSFDPQARSKHNLRGVNAMFGSTVIPNRWPWKITLAVEGKYLLLYREIHAGGNTFAMTNSQLSLGAGLRYAVFPVVLQAHYQQIVFSRQNYNFNINGTRKATTISSGGSVVFARLSLLDPAGSDGGWGFFLEYGQVFLNHNRHNESLTNVVKTFHETFEGSRNSSSHYGFFSIGFTVPLAVRIN
jgi:hypothetical protein